MSATATNVNFMGMPVEEVVPDAAMVKGVSRSSLLTGRRRVRLQPQTGTSAVAGNIIQFVLADSSSLLDLNSVVISATVQVGSANNATGNATADAALDDGPAWIRRATIALNGTNIDDTDLANRFANANIQAGADQSWYRGAGTFAGFWAANPGLAITAPGAGVGTATVSNYAVGDLSGAVVAAANRYGNGLNAAIVAQSTFPATGMQLAYPLALVSRFFATKQYLPLSQCGELVVQLLCAGNAEAIFQKSGATDATYKLTNIFLEADFVQPHYLYQEMLNRVTQLEGEQGMVIPFNAVISAQGQSVNGSGQANIVTSLATNNLRRITVTQSPTDYLNSINFPAVSCFGNNGLTGLQFRVGSLYFPSQEATNLGEIFWMSQSAYNHGEPMHQQNGLMDYNLFSKTTSPSGWQTTSSTYNPALTGTLAAFGTGTTANAYGSYQQYWGDSCVISYGFDNFKGGEALDADGISVLGQAGSQIVTLLRIAPAIGTNAATNGTTRSYIGSGVTPNIHLERTRYLVLRMGSLRVEGV